jgi:hypothetical protein
MIASAPVNQVKQTLLSSAVWALLVGVMIHAFVVYWVGQHPESSATIVDQGINALLRATLITVHYWVSLGVFVFYGWISLASYRLKRIKAEVYVLEGLYRLRMYLGVVAMFEAITVYWAQPEAVSAVCMPIAAIICLKFFFHDVFQSADAS